MGQWAEPWVRSPATSTTMGIRTSPASLLQRFLTFYFPSRFIQVMPCHPLYQPQWTRAMEEGVAERRQTWQIRNLSTVSQCAKITASPHPHRFEKRLVIISKIKLWIKGNPPPCFHRYRPGPGEILNSFLATLIDSRVYVPYERSFCPYDDLVDQTLGNINDNILIREKTNRSYPCSLQQCLIPDQVTIPHKYYLIQLLKTKLLTLHQVRYDT